LVIEVAVHNGTIFGVCCFHNSQFRWYQKWRTNIPALLLLEAKIPVGSKALTPTPTAAALLQANPMMRTM
jgi:hypothetical protein